MRYLLFTISLLIFSSLNVFSQFNIIVEDSTRNRNYTYTYIDTNNYVIINGTYNNGEGAVSFTKTDSTGKILWNKYYSKPNETWYTTPCLIKKDTVFYTPILKMGSFGYPSIMCLNTNFDTLYTRYYIYDTLFHSYTYMHQIDEKGYILCGQKKDTSENVLALMVKIDSLLNVEWEKSYGGSHTDYFKKTLQTYDNGFISIGFTYSYSSAIYKQDWYIVKTDSVGNLQWWQHPGNPNLDDGAAQGIVQTQDSCFVIVGGKAVYKDAGGTKYDGRIMKYDKNGTLLWDKTYRKKLTESNDDSLYCFFSSIIELDNGGFAVVANEQILQGAGHYNSVLYRFNSEGDTLWTRHYCTRCEYTTIDFPGQEYPSTIQKTENGGFLIGGWGNFSYTFVHPYEQQMFLIKTDSLGCDGTEFSCPLVSVPRIVYSEESVLVYPNPATNSLTINAKHLEAAMHLQDNEVFIYDVYGRAEKLPLIKGVGGIFSINISTLQKGIYFVKIGDITKKFVKL